MRLKFFTTTCLVFIISFGFSQNVTPNKNWHTYSPYYFDNIGIDLDRAYQELADNEQAQKVVVAVIDSGVDVDHEDLQGKIWINEDEIADNGIDDDNNGYIDDVNGWSFIGGPDGNVDYDLLEFTRIYKKLHVRYDGVSRSSLAADELEDYNQYLKMKPDYENRIRQAKAGLEELKMTKRFIVALKEQLEDKLGEDFGEEEIDNQEWDESEKDVVELNRAIIKDDLETQMDEAIADQEATIDKMYSLEWDPRYIVGDDYEDVDERFYGNNHVWGPHADHGTHVAGIIAANRDNEKGGKGIADAAEIMVLRVVPNGDERDKDVANAIRYAVDNGAKIINMSFGKAYSPQKTAVDEAVKYAEQNNVLLVHAAGNSSKNIDIADNFPTATFEDGGRSTTWIEVGASSHETRTKLATNFTNFGRNSVDLFAPGHDIYSATPDQNYAYFSGTSMASPVVAGVAALVWSHYPKLTAVQVKEILEKSVSPFSKAKVKDPSRPGKYIKFKTMSRTAGVVNAYEAIRLAAQY